MCKAIEDRCKESNKELLLELYNEKKITLEDLVEKLNISKKEVEKLVKE